MTNYNPIHRLRPDKVLIYGLVFYLVMFFIAPVSIKKTITTTEGTDINGNIVYKTYNLNR